MKTRILAASALALALAVPGFAQDNQSNTNPSQTDSKQVTNNSQLPQSSAPADAGQLQPLKVESKEGFWGHLNPFARKKYVRRQMAPIVGRVNELDELTASNSKSIKDVDARASEGIRLASAKANEADSHAVDAGIAPIRPARPPSR